MDASLKYIDLVNISFYQNDTRTFQVLELESSTTKRKKQCHPALKCLGNNLGLVLFVLLEIPPVGLFSGLFYLGHYFEFASPRHSQDLIHPGVIAVTMVLEFLSGGLAMLQGLYLAYCRDSFKYMFGMEMRRSTMVISRTLYGILVGVFSAAVILIITDEFRWNIFGLVESNTTA